MSEKYELILIPVCGISWFPENSDVATQIRGKTSNFD